LSSKLVKAFQVIHKNERKIVAIPVSDNTGETHHGADAHSNTSHDKHEEILERFHLELQQKREQAQQEFAAWRQAEEERFYQHLQEMKEEAYEKGYQAGIEEAKESYKEHLQRAASILEQAYAEKAAIIREAEPFVVELSTEIARKIVQQELNMHPETLLHMIKHALSNIPESSSVSIGVAPEDFEFVQKQREQLLAVVNGQVEVKVFPDYSIQQGGCYIRTPYGNIDARIDMQLSEIKKALLSLQQEAIYE
jgi:flagellar assembly protein FliH